MKPLRKQFGAEDRFPFRLVYRDTKSPLWELPDHLHDWYELIYVYSGKGTLFVNQTFYDMRAGDLFLIPSITIHRAFPDERTPVTSTAVFFGQALARPVELGEPFPLLRCFELARKRRSYKLETGAALRKTIVRALGGMQKELAAKQPGYRQAVLIRLHELLLAVNRSAAAPGASGNTGDSSGGPVWMRDTLAFIDANAASPEMKLNGLARRAAITPSHFSRVFKQLTGMTVTDYVSAKRIMAAKELLLRTDDSIGDLSRQCGFESESYFYKTFKSFTGVTPTAYRRTQGL